MEDRSDAYIEDLILGYFTQQLTACQEQELLEWLNEDPSHKETLSRMADNWAAAHVPLFIANKSTDLSGFFERQAQMNHPGKISRIFTLVFLRQVAAVALALVMVGTASYYFGKQKTQAGISGWMNRPVISEIITPMGSTSQVLLPDGTHVKVNAGTQLTYHYSEGIREVFLQGEAYFDVFPDKENPFVVKTNGMDIKVLGTSFNIRSYEDDAAVKVALVTGSVDVMINRATADNAHYTLSPDRMLTLHRGSHQVEITPFHSRDVLAWTTGGLKFENLSFASIVKELERKFDVQIHVESERLMKEIFSGSFSAGYSLEQILREVDMEKKYKWTQHRDEIIIRDKYQ